MLKCVKETDTNTRTILVVVVVFKFSGAQGELL